MDTDDIMNLALRLADLEEIPPDSAILVPCRGVRRVLLGIDIGEEDLRDAAAEGFDLVLAHHPFRRDGFLRVMDRHELLMLQHGVPPQLARTACAANRDAYARLAAGAAHGEAAERLAALASSLRLGLMNIHLPCDELGRRALQRVADSVAPAGTVERLMEAFRALPEVAASGEQVELVCGSPGRAAGRTAVIHGAGTNGGHPVADALFHSGVSTVVYIHLRDAERSRLCGEGRGNLILTGHYGSDSLGINPLVDSLEESGVEVECRNRMVRVRRAGGPRG